MNPKNLDLRRKTEMTTTKFKKTPGGVINPLMHKREKKVYDRLNKKMEEKILLKGKKMEYFDNYIQRQDYPEYLIKPFIYLKRVNKEKTIIEKKIENEKKWNKSTNLKSLQKFQFGKKKKNLFNLKSKKEKNSIYDLKMQKLLYSIFDEIKLQLIHKENLEGKLIFKKLKKFFYFYIFKFSDYCLMPKQNYKDFLHAPDKVKKLSFFANLKEKKINPILITKERFLKFFDLHFKRINKKNLEDIFYFYSDFNLINNLKVKKLCLYAFGYNFEQYLNGLNPNLNILSTRKLSILKNQLSLYLRKNNICNHLYLNFSVNYENILFNFFSSNLEFKNILDISLNDLKKFINKSDFLEFFFKLKQNFNFIVENKQDSAVIYFLEFFEEIFNDLKMDLKSKKQIVIFLDSIERSNFEANYILDSLKIFINHKIENLDNMGILINDFIKLKIKNNDNFFSGSNLKEYLNNLQDLEERNIFEISIDKFFNYVEKFLENQKTDEFHIDDLEEFFDHHSEKIRFHINSLMDFFDIVNKYKNLYKKNIKNYNLENKIGDNLFFKFVTDLLFFNDMEIEDKIVSLINIHEIYRDIEIKNQTEIFFKDFFLNSKQSELPDNLLNEKIIIDLKNYQCISFGKNKKNSFVHFENNSLDNNYNNDFLDFENLKNTVKENFTNKFKITIDKKNLKEDTTVNDGREYFKDIKNKTEKFNNLNWNKYRNISLDNLYTPSYYKNYTEKQIVRNKNYINENFNYNENEKIEDFNNQENNYKNSEYNYEKKFNRFNDNNFESFYEKEINKLHNNNFEELNYKKKNISKSNYNNFEESNYEGNFDNLKENNLKKRNLKEKNYKNQKQNFLEKNLHYSLNKYNNEDHFDNINLDNKYSKNNLQFSQKSKINNFENNFIKRKNEEEISDFFEEKNNHYINNLKNFENALKTQVINNKLKKQNFSQNNFYLNALNKIKKDYKDFDYLKKINDPDEVAYITYDTIVDELKEEEKELIQKKNFEGFTT